jgi:HSP90 family molecular chaperone
MRPDLWLFRLQRTVSKPESVPDPSKPLNADGQMPMKTVMNRVAEWVVVNDKKPLWMRSPKNCSEDDYTEFYQQTFKSEDVPLAHSHFSVEGNVDFRALLYIPREVPMELTRDMFANAARSLRLYVKRVFINDKFEDLLPRWLIFLKGVVDSDDFQLNVSREILQQTRSLRLIRQRMIKKAIDMMTDLADTNSTEYTQFFKNFGRYLKIGVLEDDMNRADLVPLLRFLTSYSTDGNTTNTAPSTATSLTNYVARMKPGQKNIYFAVGESVAQVSASPTLERIKQKGYEVLYVTDPIDEMTLQSIAKVDEFPIVDAGKEAMRKRDAAGKLQDGFQHEDDLFTTGEKQEQQSLSNEFVEFNNWMKSVLDGKVTRVEISNRLVDSPATLVQSEYGLSPTMQRYLRAQQQALEEADDPGDAGAQKNRDLNKQFAEVLYGQAVLEINPDHPVIKYLKAASASNPVSQQAVDMAALLYANSAFAAGFLLDNSVPYSQLVTKLLTQVSTAADGTV